MSKCLADISFASVAEICEINQINQIKCLEILLVTNFYTLRSLKRTSTWQKHNYLLLVERMIYLTEHLQLLKQHAELVEGFGLSDTYQQLTGQLTSQKRKIIHESLAPFLPKEVVEIIIGYAKFCWLVEPDEEEDEIFRNILKIPQDF